MIELMSEPVSQKDSTGRTARVVRAAVLIPVALMGTLATSKGTARPPSVVSKSDDGRVWYGNGSARQYVSADGGRTFTEQRPEVRLATLTQDCAGQTCYRVVRGELGVEASSDGGQTWTTSWRATWGQRRDLIAAESVWDNEDATDNWESLSLAVVPTPGTPAGHRVLLANGRAGLWLRDSDGMWNRVSLLARQGGVIEPVLAAELSQGLLPGGEAYFFLTAVILFQLLGGLGFIALKARAPLRLSRWVAMFTIASSVAITGDVLVVQLGAAAHPAEIVTAAVLATACLGMAVWLMVRYRPVVPIGYLMAMLGVIGLATWWMEYLRLGGRLSVVALGLLFIPFCLCAIIGVGAKQWPAPPATVR